MILKGKGVAFTDPTTGQRIPMSFPQQGNPYMDKVNHFFIHPLTQKPFENMQHRWPTEAAAHKIATDMLKHNHPLSMNDYGHSLKFARGLMNHAYKQTNKDSRAAGNHDNVVPIPFIEDGEGSPTHQLHPAYAANVYGGYQKRGTPAGDKQFYDENGQLHTMNTNSAPHATLGHFPETGVLHGGDRLSENLNKYGIKTRIALEGNHIEPEHIVTDEQGNSPLKRHTSFSDDPFNTAHPSYSTSARAAMTDRGHYGPINPASILHMVPARFFIHERGVGRPPAKRVEGIMAGGFDEATATEMAKSPIAQIMVPGGRGARGSATRFNNLLHAMKETLHANSGQRNEGLFQHDLKEIGYGDWHGGQTQVSAARQLLALSLTADRLGPSWNLDRLFPARPNPDIQRAWQEYGERFKGETPTFSLESRGMAEESTSPEASLINKPSEWSHLHSNIPEYVKTPPAGIDARPGRVTPSLAGMPEDEVRTSTDSPFDRVFDVIERVQLAEARLDPYVLKQLDGLDNPHDMDSVADSLNIQRQDILAIRHSRGDWERIAKSFHITPEVVGLVKVAFMGQ
jgi:hypothetical protein